MIYEPNYIYWYHREFLADVQVSRGMSPLQRNLYMRLCIEVFYCSTRPYLPDDDNQLWLLADADSKEQWVANKAPILVKFQHVTVKGVELLAHKRILSDWKDMLSADRQRHDAAYAGGKASGKARKAKSEQKLSGPESNRSVHGNEVPGSRIEPTEPNPTEPLPDSTEQQTVLDATKPNLTPTTNQDDSGSGQVGSDSLGSSGHQGSVSGNPSGFHTCTRTTT